MLTWRRLWTGSREKCAARLKTNNNKKLGNVAFWQSKYSVKSITKFSGLLISSEKTTKRPRFRCKEDE